MSNLLTLRLAMPGLPALSVSLSRLRTDIADWTPFWTDYLRPAFYRLMLDTFVLEGGNTGARWQPLSPAYAVWKASRFPGTGILVRTGALKASLIAPDNAGAVFRPTATSVEIGTTVPYAAHHQYGTGRLPQRPMLRVTEAFTLTMGRSLQQYVQKVWAQRRAEAQAAVAGGAAA